MLRHETIYKTPTSGYCFISECYAFLHFSNVDVPFFSSIKIRMVQNCVSGLTFNYVSEGLIHQLSIHRQYFLYFKFSINIENKNARQHKICHTYRHMSLSFPRFCLFFAYTCFLSYFLCPFSCCGKLMTSCFCVIVVSVNYS